METSIKVETKVETKVEQSVPLITEEQLQQLKVERQRQKEKEFINPFLETFCKVLENRVMDACLENEVEKYISNLTMEVALGNVRRVLNNITSNIGSYDDAQENCLFMEDLQEQVFYLFCVTQLEYKKQEKLFEQERDDLNDLEAAKPIFEMLKREILHYEDDFDEWTIGQYVAEMLKIAQKHGVDLGINNGSESETKEESETKG